MTVPESTQISPTTCHLGILPPRCRSRRRGFAHLSTQSRPGQGSTNPTNRGRRSLFRAATRELLHRAVDRASSGSAIEVECAVWIDLHGVARVAGVGLAAQSHRHEAIVSTVAHDDGTDLAGRAALDEENWCQPGGAGPVASAPGACCCRRPAGIPPSGVNSRMDGTEGSS